MLGVVPKNERGKDNVPGKGDARIVPVRPSNWKAKSRWDNKMWLSKTTVEVLNADGEMASCAIRLAKGQRGLMAPFFERARSALIDYKKDAFVRSSSSSHGGGRGLSSVYRAGALPDTGKSRSMPPLSRSCFGSAPLSASPGTALGTRPFTAPVLALFGPRDANGTTPSTSVTEISAGEVPTKAVTRATLSVENGAGLAADSMSKRTLRKQASKLQFAGDYGDSNPTCQLARSCRRANAEEAERQLSPVAWMLQGNRLPGEVGNDELGQDHSKDEDDGNEENPDRELSHFQAFELAKQVNLPAGQVTDAWRKFKRYDSSNRGRLTPCEFQLLLRSLLREQFPQVADIPRGLFSRPGGYKDKDISFAEFVCWLSEHAFAEEILLTAEQRSLRALAREDKVSIPLVEDIMRLFNTHDVNGNGYLDFEEFCELFCKIMGTSSCDPRKQLPETRIKSFWMEVDTTKSGQVRFDQFLAWYLRYFDKSGMPLGTSPLEDYYESIRRVPRKKLTMGSTFW